MWVFSPSYSIYSFAIYKRYIRSSLCINPLVTNIIHITRFVMQETSVDGEQWSKLLIKSREHKWKDLDISAFELLEIYYAIVLMNAESNEHPHKH